MSGATCRVGVANVVTSLSGHEAEQATPVLTSLYVVLDLSKWSGEVNYNSEYFLEGIKCVTVQSSS